MHRQVDVEFTSGQGGGRSAWRIGEQRLKSVRSCGKSASKRGRSCSCARNNRASGGDTGGGDEVISTRRLDHIVKAFTIFGDKMKSIELCVARFDDDTKESFLDLYTKIDAGINVNEETEIPNALRNDIEEENKEAF